VQAVPADISRRLSGPGRVIGDAAGAGVALALGAVAAARRGKAVHPHGVVHEAALVVEGGPGAPRGAPFLERRARHRGIVRFSRSVGLPRPLPDLLGMSIRLPGVHGEGGDQDFLLISSADRPLVHHLFLPANDVQQRPYSSSLPYRSGARLYLIGALPRPDSPRPSGRDELDRLHKAAATGGLSFDFAVAPLGGRFAPVGRLEVGARLGPELDALRFNPHNTGGGLEPSGLLNRMREQAYPASQRAWAATGRGDAARQRAADRALDELLTRS